MMNPSEIDAGPPNKKPKMVVGVGGGANTNGYQTQMSESKGELLLGCAAVALVDLDRLSIVSRANVRGH